MDIKHVVENKIITQTKSIGYRIYTPEPGCWYPPRPGRPRWIPTSRLRDVNTVSYTSGLSNGYYPEGYVRGLKLVSSCEPLHTEHPITEYLLMPLA